MDTDFTLYIILFFIFAPMALFALGIVGVIVGHFKKSEKIKNVGKCLLAWTTLFFLLPGIAKRAGFIKKKLVGWIIALLAPPLFVLYWLSYWFCTMVLPLPFDKLKFTSHDEIAAITEIPDFPQFKYVKNIHNGWDGTTTTWNEFTDSMEVQRLFAYLDSVVESKDNICWSKDSIHDIDIKTRTEMCYTYNHGWDGKYIKCPKGISDSCTQVSIRIYKDGFSIKPTYCWGEHIEHYANPDTLNKITGVDFPTLEFVNVQYNDYWREWDWKATAKMKHKPSKKFLRELKSSAKWTENDGTFYLDLGEVNPYEYITVDPSNCFVTFSHGVW